jgi:hypothetical protein
VNQFIVAAVAEEVAVIETAREFLERRAGNAKPRTCSGPCARRGRRGGVARRPRDRSIRRARRPVSSPVKQTVR